MRTDDYLSKTIGEAFTPRLSVKMADGLNPIATTRMA
jgi:hypothetical protein